MSPSTPPTLRNSTLTNLESEILTKMNLDPVPSYHYISEKATLLAADDLTPSNLLDPKRSKKVPTKYFKVLAGTTVANYVLFLTIQCVSCCLSMSSSLSTAASSAIDEGIEMASNSSIHDHHHMHNMTGTGATATKVMECCSWSRMLITLVLVIGFACVQAGVLEWHFRNKERVRDLELGMTEVVFDVDVEEV